MDNSTRQPGNFFKKFKNIHDREHKLNTEPSLKEKPYEEKLSFYGSGNRKDANDNPFAFLKLKVGEAAQKPYKDPIDTKLKQAQLLGGGRRRSDSAQKRKSGLFTQTISHLNRSGIEVRRERSASREASIDPVERLNKFDSSHYLLEDLRGEYKELLVKHFEMKQKLKKDHEVKEAMLRSELDQAKQEIKTLRSELTKAVKGSKQEWSSTDDDFDGYTNPFEMVKSLRERTEGLNKLNSTLAKSLKRANAKIIELEGKLRQEDAKTSPFLAEVAKRDRKLKSVDTIGNITFQNTPKFTYSSMHHRHNSVGVNETLETPRFEKGGFIEVDQRPWHERNNLLFSVKKPQKKESIKGFMGSKINQPSWLDSTRLDDIESRLMAFDSSRDDNSNFLRRDWTLSNALHH